MAHSNSSRSGSSLLERALSRVGGHDRNNTGLWLACQLRDSGCNQDEAEHVMLEYASRVDGGSADPYTPEEAVSTLKSAFSRPARAHAAGGNLSVGGPCQRVKPGANRVRNDVDGGGAGLTLATLAEAKGFTVDELKGFGVSDRNQNGTWVVRIPYHTEDGTEAAVRLRLGLGKEDGPRFKWRKGDKAMPYGLNRLAAVRKTGWVLIVEGESDCWTCWHYGIPALGAPGKSVWPKAWGEHLSGIDVYVWQEPDAQDFTLRVLQSAPAARYIIAQDGIKDISEAHTGGLDVPGWLEHLKAKAELGSALLQRLADARLTEAYEQARGVIESDDPLSLIADGIRALGYGGDLKPAMVTYLAATSRLLEMRRGAMPVHLLLTGHSSGGKSYTLSVVMALMPPEAYHIIDAGSPRVLIYDEEPLEHRALIFGEADSLPAGEDNPAASAIRNLLQDHQMHYEVTVKDPETGDHRVRRVEKPGPTVLITTSTRPLGDQLMTRLFAQEIGDSKEQIAAALKAQAKLELEGVSAPDCRLVAMQLYLQLTAPIAVVVPFVDELAEAIARLGSAPRIMRDFARLVSLVKAVATLRQYRRRRDCAGRIVADLNDYDTVRGLVEEMYADSTTGFTRDVQELVATVAHLCAVRPEEERITNTVLSKELGTGVKQVTRRAKRAIKDGWLVNREQRKSYPADYAPGEPMPECPGLPRLTGLACVPAGVSSAAEAEVSTVDTLTGVTDGDGSRGAVDLPGMLGMPVERAVRLWRDCGAPVVQLTPGESCSDLERLLASPCLKSEHMAGVRQWLCGCGLSDGGEEVRHE